MRPSVLRLVTLLACAGCAAEPASNPVKDAFAASQHITGLGEAVAFAFSSARGTRPVMYRLPALEPGQVRVESQPDGLRAVVGFVADRDIIYVITSGDELAALDLTTGRFRVVDSSAAAGAIGPTGTPFVVHADGSVATIGLKSITPWPNGFDAPPAELYGVVRDRLVAVVEGDSGRRLVLAASGQPSIEQPLPAGRLHVSAWGDAVIVAADSGIVILDPADPDAVTFHPVVPALLDADFSASGHRIHVMHRDGTVESIDRFSLEPIGRLTLDEPPQAWRTDRWGRYLLFQGQPASPIVVVDAVLLAVVDSIDGSWDEQLPMTAPDGSVLVRREDRVVTWVPGNPEPVARIAAPESVTWLVTAWDATRPLETVVEAGAPEATAPGQELFVQVSSTTNADWAADLATNLRRAGMPASVLSPEQPLEPYRVVLGPYGTREEAEATGRQLRLPFWIFVRDSTTTEP